MVHYYTRHIGDYAKDTSHLSLLEHGIYTVLLDWAYATERPLPGDRDAVYRICRAITSAEKKAVDAVVLEFFNDTAGQLVNNRVQLEILKFKAKADQSRKANEVRWDSKRNPNRHTSGHPDGHTDGHPDGYADGVRTESHARARPLTNNQEPSTHTPSEFPEVCVPSRDEVVAWAESAGVDAAWSIRRWENLTGQHGWERNGRLIDWQRLFRVWFHEDVRLKRWKIVPESGSEKNRGEKNAGGESKAQRLFKLDKKIEELETQIEGFESTQPELAEQLESELKKVRAERAEVSA